jgi:predicted DNA-binding protein (MmcQ/YjbR family)
MNPNMARIIKMIETLPDTTTRPMFGYQCYSARGKFFAGFGKKDELIIRLPKEDQLEALKDRRLKIKPFSHGAKMGWVQLDAKSMTNDKTVFDWIKKGYVYAQLLSNTS